MFPKVGIIILNWNGLSDTLKCIDSLKLVIYSNFEIIIVDNGSSDNSAQIIEDLHPEIHLLRNEKNEGFCKGNNQGIRYALERNAEYVWLLNSDTVVEPDTLEKIVNMAEESPQIGLVSPMIHYYDQKNKVQFGGSYIDRSRYLLYYPNDKNAAGEEYRNSTNIILWGTALLVKRALVEKIGFLTEEFFAYWEDTDFCLRSLENGYRNILCNTAKIYHKRKLTPSGNEIPKGAFFYYLIERNYLLLLRSRMQKPFSKFKFVFKGLATASAHTLTCPKEFRKLLLAGMWHGLHGIGGQKKENPSIPPLLGWFLQIIAPLHPLFWFYLVTLDFKMVFEHAIKKINFNLKNCPV